MGRQFGARARQRFRHFAQDMRAALMRLRKRRFHDLFGDTGDLDVHLQRGNALARPGDLEIHVAQMILVTQNVGQDGKLLALQDQAHRDAADRPLDRHARVHKAERATAHRRHRRRAVRLRNVAGDADGVGKFFLRRQHCVQRAPGELAVADIAAARRAKAANLAHRIGWEVIVQHEMLIAEPCQPIDHLLGILGAQRRGRDGLRLAAGEQRRTMRAGQEMDLGFDRADLRRGAPVDASAIAQDRAAHDFGLQLLDQLLCGHLFLRGAVGHCRLGLAASCVQHVGAVGLECGLVSGGNIVADQRLQLGLHRSRVIGNRKFPRLLRCLLRQRDDRADHLLRRLVRKHHRAEHDIL